jgi:hypothetical protein
MQPGRCRGDQLVASTLQQLAGVRLGVGALAAVGTRGEMSLDRRALFSGRLAIDVWREERFEVLTGTHLATIVILFH